VRVRSPGLGTRRIQMELARHGLKIAAQPLQQLARQRTAACGSQLWQRRFGMPAQDLRERARQMRFLPDAAFRARSSARCWRPATTVLQDDSRELDRFPAAGSVPMKIHEYQARNCCARTACRCRAATRPSACARPTEAAQKLGGAVWVVKAQIHAGGRGKGGGVKLARSSTRSSTLAGQILGMQLKTHQTGPEGQKVRRLLHRGRRRHQARSTTSPLVTDRATQSVAMMASSEGGMDIEEVAHSTPEKIIKVFVDPLTGLTDAAGARTRRRHRRARRTAARRRRSTCLKKLYACYMATDASLAEINPLILEGNGNIKALDAKFNFDANALYRHPEIVAYRDLDEEDPAEIEASKFDLSYISLDGNIGCLVNGAGLAMATMDTIKLFGGEPANFLDVGGGATAEKVTEAFKIMLANKSVKGILVNIFGGIMKCDTIAEGVIAACKAVNLSVPLVVRMKGTNEDLGKKMLKPKRPADHQRRHHGRGRHQDRRRREVRPRNTDMSILINKDTKVITQGITGKTGQFHTRMCRDYANGKNCFVAGVNPKKAGEDFEGIPIYASVKDAKAQTGATRQRDLRAAGRRRRRDLGGGGSRPGPGDLHHRRHSHPRHAGGAQPDEGQGSRRRQEDAAAGPQLPGLITPDEIKIGIMPGHIHRKGRIGVVSRSGTLTYEAVAQLTEIGLGQSSAVGIGGDPINGLKHIDVMRLFNDDPDTDAVIMIGEIGGPDEAEAARWCKANMKKPIVGFIAGVTAPAGKRMGHAGALISGGADTADAKLAIMEECGFTVTRNPSEMGPSEMAKLLK
jgi:succinyl-CoA synthetase beta subunit